MWRKPEYPEKTTVGFICGGNWSTHIWDPHTQQQKLQIEKIQQRAARYVSNRYHNTSSVTDMMSDLNWAPLEVCRIRYRLIFFYKVIHHLVAIPYSNLLIPVDTRTRHTNPYSFRHIQTSKDCYKYDSAIVRRSDSPTVRQMLYFFES